MIILSPIAKIFDINNKKVKLKYHPCPPKQEHLYELDQAQRMESWRLHKESCAKKMLAVKIKTGDRS